MAIVVMVIFGMTSHLGNDKKGMIEELGVDFNLRYTMGDTVGAGVNYVTWEIFFSKNQKFVHSVPCNLKTSLYPTIGFSYGSQSLGIESKSTMQVNFLEPHVFNVIHRMQHSNLKT